MNASGTREQIPGDLSSTALVRKDDRIMSIKITPQTDNTGDMMHWGSISVTTAYGERIPKGVSTTINFDPSTMKFSDMYMDADASGDAASWVVVF